MELDEKAKDYARTRLEDSLMFGELDIDEKVIVLQLLDEYVRYYLMGCFHSRYDEDAKLKQ